MGRGRRQLEHWIAVAGHDLLVPAPAEPAPRRTSAAAGARLAELAAVARTCTACPLHAGRTQAVWADGSETARVLFVGEGPGRDEDRIGRPFVGRAGQLLTDIIERAMGLPREAVYICNVVKCRPPGNRNPTDAEQAACGAFLQAQIELVAPEVIVALGKVAAQYLLDSNLSMTRLRKGTWDYDGIPVFPTWHPAYLLRTPAAKAETWTDIKRVLAQLGLPETPAPHRREREAR